MAEDFTFEAARHLISVKQSIDVNFIVEGGYDSNDKREQLYTINNRSNTLETDNERWLADLFNRACGFVAQHVYRFMSDERAWEHDNSNGYHHHKHNGTYYAIRDNGLVANPDIFTNWIDNMRNGLGYGTDELNTFGCLDKNWYVYLDVEALSQVEADTTVVTIYIKRAPVLGTFQPFSLQSSAASVVVSELVNDTYDKKTCMNLLYLTQQTRSLSNLSIRCGPNNSRFIYSFNSIVKNYCFLRILSQQIKVNCSLSFLQWNSK